jgi:hypothetical protein
MNKLVIDFPPGACGHFLARALNNEYDFKVGLSGEIHSLNHNYSSITTSESQFNNMFFSRLPTAMNANVICLHNFSNLDLHSYFPDHKLINVFLDDKFEIFAKNFYHKAIGTHKNTKNDYHKSIASKFVDSVCPLREEYYYFYNWLRNSNWTKQKENYYNLPFSYIYDKDKLQNFFADTGIEIPQNWDSIHNNFLLAQKKILDEVNEYHTIVTHIIQKTYYEIPKNLTDIDFGIISGILKNITNKEVTYIGSKNWFSNTHQLLDYINE